MADPAATLLDDFNRANTGPPPSSSWTNGILTFVAGEGLVVLSNACTRKSTGGVRQGSYWNAQDFGPDVCIIADVSAWSTVENSALQLYARLVNIGSGTTDGYALVVVKTATSTDFEIWRVDNAATPSLVSATQAVAAGDQVAFTLVGSTLIGWHKPAAGSWAQIVTVTDATYTAAGKVGAEVVNINQTTRFDNFSAASLVFGASSSTFTFGASSSGTPTALGASTLTVTAGVDSAGVPTALGSSSTTITAGIASTGVPTALGSSTLTVTAGIASAGTPTAFGSSSLPITAGITSSGSTTSIAFGSSSLTLTAAIVSDGVPTALASSASTYTAGIVSTGLPTALGSSSTTITVGFDSAGQVPGVAVTGRFDAPTPGGKTNPGTPGATMFGRANPGRTVV